MITISSLPRYAVCPGAAALPHADASSDDAEAGVSNHTAAEAAVKYGDVEKLPVEIRALIPKGSQPFTEAVVYYDFVADTARLPNNVAHGRRAYTPGPTEIPGTIDLLIVGNLGEITVLDYKRHEDVGNPDENEQLLGYALAAARIFKADKVRLAVAYIEADADGYVTLTRPLVIRDVDGLDLDAFAVKLRAIVRAVDLEREKDVPNVRESPKACRHCPAVASCPPKLALVTRMAKGDALLELEQMLPLTPETVGTAYENWKYAKSVLDRVHKNIMGYASEHDVPLRDGQVLGRRMVKADEALDGAITHAVLLEKFGAPVADEATLKREGTKVGIKRALKQAAGVTNLSKAEREIIEEIRKRGGSNVDAAGNRPLKSTIDEHEATCG